MKLDIVYEDEYMMAVVKPYGVPAQADHSNREDMISIVKNEIFDRGDTDGEPYLAVINRLDRPVSGIMLFAKTEEAAAKLSDLRGARKAEHRKDQDRKINEQKHDDKVSAFYYFGHYRSAPPLGFSSPSSDVSRVNRQMITSRISAIIDPPCQL